jgi:4-hydroxy-4-methyl-2-oxoglutarate aldolase
MTPAAQARLQALGTAVLSDALDRLGVNGALRGLVPVWDGLRMAGPAFTVRYVPAATPPGSVGDYIDDVDEGAVIVLDNGGRLDATVWGDLLTGVAGQRRLGGTVIDGVCRDTDRAQAAGYPIYSRGRFMRTGKDRVEVADVQTPVSVGGCRIAPGDLLLGDNDGVVNLPGPLLGAILDVAEEIACAEAAIAADVAAGAPLGEARAAHGYHGLQRRSSR